MLRITVTRRPRLVEQLVPHEQCRPKRATGITSRRLNPDVLEWPFTLKSAVGDTVERHAASHDQVAFARRLVDSPAHTQHAFLGDALDARGEIHVTLLE